MSIELIAFIAVVILVHWISSSGESSFSALGKVGRWIDTYILFFEKPLRKRWKDNEALAQGTLLSTEVRAKHLRIAKHAKYTLYAIYALLIGVPLVLLVLFVFLGKIYRLWYGPKAPFFWPAT